MQALQLLFKSVGRLVRLACLRHAASVHPEPGSNSPKKLFFRSFELVYFLVLPSFSNYLTFCSVFRDHFTCFLFASCFINIPNFFRYVNDFFYFFIYFFGIFFLLHSLFRECPFNISFYFFSVNPFCENYSIFFDFLQLFSFLLVFA